MKVNINLKPEYLFIILWKSNKEKKLIFFLATFKESFESSVCTFWDVILWLDMILPAVVTMMESLFLESYS